MTKLEPRDLPTRLPHPYASSSRHQRLKSSVRSCRQITAISKINSSPSLPDASTATVQRMHSSIKCRMIAACPCESSKNIRSPWTISLNRMLIRTVVRARGDDRCHMRQILHVSTADLIIATAFEGASGDCNRLYIACAVA